MYEKVKSNSYNEHIYCSCRWRWKEKLKKLGFRWSSEIKLWYIPEKYFTEELYEKTQEVFDENESAFEEFFVIYKPKSYVEELVKRFPSRSNKYDQYLF